MSIVHVDNLAMTDRSRFGMINLSQWTVPSTGGGGASFVAGDLLVVSEVAINTGAGIPSDVTPTGMTVATTTRTLVNANGDGCRLSTWYMIMTSSTPGSTMTGMAGTAFSQISAAAFHFNRPLQSITQVTASSLSELALGIPSNQVVAWDSVSTGAHMYIGCALGDGNASNTILDTEYGWTSGPDGSAYFTSQPDLGSQTNTRLWYSFTPIGVSPTATTTMALSADQGAWNAHTGMLLRLN